MKIRITGTILTTAAMILFTAAVPGVSAQERQERDKTTATGQMRESGRETGRAGKSLGHNMKHGRVVRGGKHFGQHMGRAGKHVGRGTKRAVTHAVTP
jgi:hypothetical protein